MEVDMVADMEVDKVVDKVTDMVADMATDKKEEKWGMQKKKKNGHAISRQKIQFGERVGNRGWLTGPKLIQSETYPACASSKLCEFIKTVR